MSGTLPASRLIPPASQTSTVEATLLESGMFVNARGSITAQPTTASTRSNCWSRSDRDLSPWRGPDLHEGRHTRPRAVVEDYRSQAKGDRGGRCLLRGLRRGHVPPAHSCAAVRAGLLTAWPRHLPLYAADEFPALRPAARAQEY